jgi:hypothetical protein
MAYVLPGREDNKQVYDLLLPPKQPFLFGEEQTLKSHSESHGQCEKQVLVVNE